MIFFPFIFSILGHEEFPVISNGFHENMSKDVQDIIPEIKKRSSSQTKSRGLISAFKSLRAGLGGPLCDVICDLLVISSRLDKSCKS